MRTDAADLAITDLTEGMAVSGTYAPDGSAMGSLATAWGVAPGRLPEGQLAAILWSSYLVGMELPGRRALFWRADLRFPAAVDGDGPGAATRRGPLAYRAVVGGLDARFDAVRIDAEIEIAGRPFATAELRAFVRPLSPRSDPSPPTRALVPGLAGKVALVTGASRRLGAANARELAMAGATVYLNSFEGTADPASGARSSQRSWAKAGRPRPPRVQRLAADPRPRLPSRWSGAAPGVRRGQPEAGVRATGHVPAAPRRAWRSGARDLVRCARHAAREWPHYVTAKASIEGLATWAAARNRGVRFVVARPPKLLTDEMNAPGGRAGAVPVDGVAARLVAALADDGERTGAIRRLGAADLA